MGGTGSGTSRVVASVTLKKSPENENGSPLQAPRMIFTNSAVRAYLVALSSVTPNRASSACSAPVTMFTNRRPFETRWYVLAIWAARVGVSSAGRNATRNFRRSVTASRAAVEIHASSQPVPQGVRTASNPSCSQAWAICCRYCTLGARLEPASGRTSRESPPVGMNQFISIIRGLPCRFVKATSGYEHIAHPGWASARLCRPFQTSMGVTTLGK